jgi:hypothetical protein
MSPYEKWCCYHQKHEPINQFGKAGSGLQSACRSGMSLYQTDRYKRDDKFKSERLAYSKRYKSTEGGKQTRRRSIESRKCKINEVALRRHHQRYATDVVYRLRFLLRSGLKKAMARDGKRRGYYFRQRKPGSAVRDLGCSIQEFKAYIAARFSGSMSWDNHGTVWQLDHVRPLALFDLSDREQVLQACHYTNLQPLFSEDHKRKTRAEIPAWRSKGADHARDFRLS